MLGLLLEQGLSMVVMNSGWTDLVLMKLMPIVHLVMKTEFVNLNLMLRNL